MDTEQVDINVGDQIELLYENEQRTTMRVTSKATRDGLEIVGLNGSTSRIQRPEKSEVNEWFFYTRHDDNKDSFGGLCAVKDANRKNNA